MSKLAALIAATALIALSTHATAQTLITLRTGLLLDGKGSTLRNQVIAIDGPRIARITANTNEPVTYDLSRLTILPGLIDTHVHIGAHFDKTGRRVSIEYALIKDMNDHAWRADLLAQKLLERGRGWVHVNPIPLNPTPGSIWTASERDVQNEFVRRLNDAGIPTTLRDTRGKEIDGACGQLAAADG